MFERRRSRIRRFFMILLVGAAGLVGAVELLNSDLMLNSKSYEIVGYSEDERIEQQDGSTKVVKTKRFPFLPGQERIMFVHDEYGRTIDRKALDCHAAKDEAMIEPAIVTEQL